MTSYKYLKVPTNSIMSMNMLCGKCYKEHPHDWQSYDVIWMDVKGVKTISVCFYKCLQKGLFVWFIFSNLNIRCCAYC